MAAISSYLTSWTPVLQSINPLTASPATQSLPAIGDPAPAPIHGIDLAAAGAGGKGKPTLVAFVRHCGCPFAEKEVRLLAEEVKRDGELRVVIVQHSALRETEEWFREIGGKQSFPDPSRYTLIADPERTVYAAWGIGQLGWSGMINGDVMAALKQLKSSEGIDLRPTGKGSWRWQNSGGFAVDREGKIRWRKVAANSADMCDYAEAARTVV